ncbi:MAG: NfeD family protein, partial [Planctomycetota bacterium]|nr:NfeD family protein [Planctomycetota bacterium]
GCLFLVGAVFLNRYLGKLPVFGKLLLVPPEQKQDLDIANADQFSQQHSVVSVGDTGTTESVLRPAGKARFGDHTVDVVADGSFIQPEETITVLQINGNRVLVVKSE